jgi:hypothetical protein
VRQLTFWLGRLELLTLFDQAFELGAAAAQLAGRPLT